jgi:hypothetical protein
VRKFASHSRLLAYKDVNFYSVLGSMSVLSGLVAAIASMPDDPQPIGTMVWPALYLTIGLLAVPILRVRRSLSSVLRTENFLMLALVYWLLLDMLRSAYPLSRVTYDSVILALTAIGVMAIGIWVGTAGKGWRPPSPIVRSVRSSINDSQLFVIALAAFLLGMFHFALSSGFNLSVMIKGLGESRFAAPWSRGAIGGWSSFSEQMVYFGYVLPSLTVLLVQRKGWFQLRVFVSAAMSFIMLIFLAQSGGRRIVGVVIGAALLSWVLMQERVRLRLAIVAAIVSILLLLVMQTMLQYRGVGLQAWVSGEESREVYSSLHVDDDFLRLSQITSLFPDEVSYVGVKALVYVLVRPIPRVFWPDKPINQGYDLPRLVGLKGSAGTSLSTSIVGELYVMDGLVAVLLGGLLFGRLARMWNKVIDMPGGTGKPLICGLGIMIFFASFRSMQDLIILSYALLAWLLVAGAVRWRKADRGDRLQRAPVLHVGRVDVD